LRLTGNLEKQQKGWADFFSSRREEDLFSTLHPYIQKKPKETNSKISGGICGLGTYLLTLYLYSCVLYLGEELTYSDFPCVN